MSLTCLPEVEYKNCCTEYLYIANKRGNCWFKQQIEFATFKKTEIFIKLRKTCDFAQTRTSKMAFCVRSIVFDGDSN